MEISCSVELDILILTSGPCADTFSFILIHLFGLELSFHNVLLKKNMFYIHYNEY